MAELTADFEAGTNGNNVLTTDAGSATAWDAVTIVQITEAPPTITYDTAHVAHGSLATKIVLPSANDNIILEWSTALGTVTDHYGRLYLYLTAYPVSAIGGLVYAGQGATRGVRIDINSSGQLRGYDNPAAAAFPTFTNAVALNQWIRIEWHFVHSATVGQAEVKLFNTAESTTPTETQTGTNKNTLANATSLRFGTPESGPGGAYTFWVDDIVGNAAAYPGPVGGGGGGPDFVPQIIIT
jgi:hypothetical protein